MKCGTTSAFESDRISQDINIEDNRKNTSMHPIGAVLGNEQ